MDPSTPHWSGVNLPVILPELVVAPTRTQIFMFSAATWNRHHIHFNRDAAIAEGLPDIVVQRALIGNYFARQLTNWLGDSGDICELSWKVLNSAVPNQNLHCQGMATETLTADSARYLICDLNIANDAGNVLATATAKVRLSPPFH